MKNKELLRKMEISMEAGFMSGKQLKHFYIDNTLPEQRDKELTELLNRIAKNDYCVVTTSELKNKIKELLKLEKEVNNGNKTRL